MNVQRSWDLPLLCQTSQLHSAEEKTASSPVLYKPAVCRLLEPSWLTVPRGSWDVRGPELSCSWCKGRRAVVRPGPWKGKALFGKWYWERLKAGGEGDDRGWDGWMVSPTQRTRLWASSGRWGRTGKPGVLQSMGSQRVGHDRATKQQQGATGSCQANWVHLLTIGFIVATIRLWRKTDSTSS